MNDEQTTLLVVLVYMKKAKSYKNVMIQMIIKNEKKLNIFSFDK